MHLRGLRRGLAVHQLGPFLRECVPPDGHPTQGAGKDSEDNLSNRSDYTPRATTELAHQPSGTFSRKPSSGRIYDANGESSEISVLAGTQSQYDYYPGDSGLSLLSP